MAREVVGGLNLDGDPGPWHRALVDQLAFMFEPAGHLLSPLRSVQPPDDGQRLGGAAAAEGDDTAEITAGLDHCI